jgi:cytochrome P450
MHDPVHQTRGWQGEWILTRYEDVRAVSRDARFRVYDVPERIREKGELLQDVHEGDLLALYTLVQNWMIFSNPPDHTRLRRLVSPAFSVRTIEKMRPMVQDLTDSLLVSLRPVGKMDIMSDLASPLTVSIIGKLLGVPDEDHQKLKVWSHDSFRAFESMLSLEFLKHLNAVAEEFTNYFWGLIEERRGHPQHDLISMLVGLNEQEDMLSDGELLGFCASLFAAGQETTLDLIGNGTLALLQHPEELERLQRDPAIIPSAIEELLRYESPVQFIPRIAKEDVEIGGKTIRAGERVLCGLGAANHDPEKFPHPHTLDLSRQNNDHVAFSGGIHHCLGAILARVEGQVVIPTLFSQLPDLQLATTTFERRENHGFRGLKALPVNWKI